MEASYKEIESIVKRVRRRLLIKSAILNIVKVLSIALIFSIFISLLSRVIPIYNVYLKAAFIILIAIPLAILFSIFTGPTLKNSAKKLDSFGLKERVSTTLEIKKGESIYKELIIEDTLIALKQLNYKKHILLWPSKAYLIILFTLSIVMFSSFFLPEPLKDKANKLHALAQYKSEQVKKVKDEEKEIESNKKLTEDQKKELLAKLEQLKSDLKAAQDKNEADKIEEKAIQKLELKKNENLTKDLNNLADKLSQSKETKNISEAIKSGDSEKLAEEINKLKNALKNMDSKGKQEVKAAISKASESTDNNDLKDQLDNFNDAITSGDEAAINSSVDKVAGAVKQAMSNEQMNKTVAELQKNMESQQGNDPGAQDNQMAQADSNGSQNGTSGSQGSGEGNGNGNSNSNGSGEQSGGSGAGSGSSNGDGGVKPYSSGGIGSKEAGSGKEKEYEKIFTPSRIGGNGESSQLTGKNNGNSGKSETTNSNNSDAELGQLKPYNQVAAEYSQKAMESLNENEIPDGMKEVVKQYFSSLQQ